jgi:hypothetical protein
MVNDYKAVQRQTAQYDLFNRLHSIAGDEAFVREIAEHYEGRYEVVGASLHLSNSQLLSVSLALKRRVVAFDW